MSSEILGMPLQQFVQGMESRTGGSLTKGYFYSEKDTGGLMLKSGETKEVTAAGEAPLSLKELVFVIKEAEDKILQDSKNASIVSAGLKQMAALKEAKDQSYNPLVRLIRLICECVRNFFSGLGLKTTAKAALELAARFDLPEGDSLKTEPEKESSKEREKSGAAMSGNESEELKGSVIALEGISLKSVLEVGASTEQPLEEIKSGEGSNCLEEVNPMKTLPFRGVKLPSEGSQADKSLATIAIEPHEIEAVPIPLSDIQVEREPLNIGETIIPESGLSKREGEMLFPKDKTKITEEIEIELPVFEPLPDFKTDPIAHLQQLSEAKGEATGPEKERPIDKVTSEARAASRPLERQRSKTASDARGRALERYAANQKGVNKMTRRIVFTEISAVENVSGYTIDETKSVQGLVQWVTNKTVVDLNDERGEQVVLDCLRECNQEIQKKTAAWLNDNQLFTPRLLKNTMQLTLDKIEAGEICDFLQLESLLNYYLENDIHTLCNLEGKPEFPVSDGVLVALVVKFMQLTPAEERIEHIVIRFMGLEGYSYEVFKKWINHYFQKEGGRASGVADYRLRDRLIHDYSRKPEWQESLKSMPALFAYVKNYLDRMASI